MDLYTANEIINNKVLEKKALIRALDSYIELADIYREELDKKEKIISELVEIIERMSKR